MSPFLHERIVLRPTNTPLPMRMPAFDSPFASIRQLSSITTLSAMLNLVRMAQHDVLPEHDVSSARAEQQRIQALAQRQPQRARHALGKQHDELVLESAPIRASRR